MNSTHPHGTSVPPSLQCGNPLSPLLVYLYSLFSLFSTSILLSFPPYSSTTFPSLLPPTPLFSSLLPPPPLFPPSSSSTPFPSLLPPPPPFPPPCYVGLQRLLGHVPDQSLPDLLSSIVKGSFEEKLKVLDAVQLVQKLKAAQPLVTRQIEVLCAYSTVIIYCQFMVRGCV